MILTLSCLHCLQLMGKCVDFKRLLLLKSVSTKTSGYKVY